MIWKTKTHEFKATVCQRTGKTCPALAQMARAIVDAMNTATPVTRPEFQVEGSSELTHCAPGCTARFKAQKERIRVFCDTPDDTLADTLDSYADMMFGATINAMPAGLMSNPPCAMLEVDALAPRPVARVDNQVAL